MEAAWKPGPPRSTPRAPAKLRRRPSSARSVLIQLQPSAYAQPS